MKVKFIILFFAFILINFSYGANIDKFSEKAYNFIVHFGDNKDKDNKSYVSKKIVIENYCKWLYQLKNFGHLTKPVKDSIFVNILCSSINYENVEDIEVPLKDKKKKYFTDLYKDAKKIAESADVMEEGNIKSILSDCKISGIVTDSDSLNNVNFICVSDVILRTILNDYSKIGVYIAYGGVASKDDIKKWEKDFFTCEDEDCVCEDSYLDSDDDSKEYCIHKETQKYLELVATSLSQISSSFELLDLKKEDIQERFLNESQKFPTLVNKMYLEYYFYNLFVSYYMLSLKYFDSFLQTKKVFSNYAKLNLYDEVSQAKKSILVFDYSLKRTLLYMKNIYWTFPIHIGFLAIIEDFKKLRKNLAWIYTPIDQLRYKLKNAQDEDKQ